MMMTLAQLEGRLTALEQIVEQLQSRLRVESDPLPCKKEREDAGEEDFIPGTENDLVITVPPEESFIIQARIVSIEPAPPGLPLSKDEWANLGLEDEDE